MLDFQEAHFECLVRAEGSGEDGELKVLCARPAVVPASQSLMDLYITHPDGTKELGCCQQGEGSPELSTAFTLKAVGHAADASEESTYWSFS